MIHDSRGWRPTCTHSASTEISVATENQPMAPDIEEHPTFLVRGARVALCAALTACASSALPNRGSAADSQTIRRVA